MKQPTQWDYDDLAEPATSPRLLHPRVILARGEITRTWCVPTKSVKSEKTILLFPVFSCSRATTDTMLRALTPQLSKQYFIKNKTLVNREYEWPTSGNLLAGDETIFPKNNKNMMEKQEWA